MISFFSSLDKELVKLAEKHAREREEREKEKREREKREHEAKEQKLASVPSNNHIQVKPIIETISPTQQSKQSRLYGKMSNGDHNMNGTEDLLRLIDLNKRISNINFLLYFQIYTTTTT